MTTKQKLAATKLVENGGNVSKSMIDAGYSKASAKNPQKLTRSKGWQPLMEKYLPEEDVLKKHGQLLNSSEIDKFIFPNDMTDKEIEFVVRKIPDAKLIQIQRNQQSARAYFSLPNNKVRKDAIDMTYKLRGRYKAEKVNDSLNEAVEAALARLNEILPESK
ncbi:MAG: hypothetical protein Q7S45_04650 [Candidatus Curtissbacteria bacterium]|nr:hypothetical protein [Candidatus Curtissbacteria bacterium]